MAAGPIGSCWASGSWSDTAWEANTWADAVAQAGHGEPWWLLYQKLRKIQRLDAEALVYGVEAKFFLGFVHVMVERAIRQSVARELASHVGAVDIRAVSAHGLDVRSRASAYAEVLADVGQVLVEGERQPSEADYQRALELIERICDAA